MANQLFPKGRQRFLDGDTDWLNSTIRAALVRGWTYNPATQSAFDQVSDITGAGGTIVQWQTIPGRTAGMSDNGIANASPVTFTAITGAAIDVVIIAHEVTAVDTDRWLLGYIDTATGLPGLVPNGGNIVVTWDTGANKIFKL